MINRPTYSSRSRFVLFYHFGNLQQLPKVRSFAIPTSPVCTLMNNTKPVVQDTRTSYRYGRTDANVTEFRHYLFYYQKTIKQCARYNGGKNDHKTDLIFKSSNKFHIISPLFFLAPFYLGKSL